MQLLSVRIQDFKLCKDVTINLQEDMTILLGRNGSGKTTLLQAIELLKSANRSTPDYVRKFEEDAFYLTQLTVTLKDNEDIYDYRMKLYFEKDEDSNRPVNVLAFLKSKKAKNWLEYNSMEFSHESMQVELAEYRGGNASPSTKYATMMSVHNFIRNLTYISSTSFLNSSDNSATIKLGRRGFYGRISRENKTFLDNLYTLSLKHPTEFKKYINVVSRIGSGLVDAIEMKSLIVPTSSIKAYRGGVLHTVEENEELYVPIFHIGHNKLYNNQLSEGTFRSLALIFYILNHKSNLLIIEEPELSVHAELLGEIVELIHVFASDKQVILSTHSERIVNMVEPKCISIVKRSDEGIQCVELSQFMSKTNFTNLQSYIDQGGTLGDYIFSEI